MANIYILNADGSKTPATKEQVVALAQSGKLTLDTKLEVLGRVVSVSKVRELRQYLPTMEKAKPESPPQIPELVSPGFSSAPAPTRNVETQKGGAVAPIPNLTGAGNLARSANANVAPYVASASTVCANCGNAITSDARFCEICGAPNNSALASASVCPYCKSPITPGARFCGACGASTSGDVGRQTNAPMIVNVQTNVAAVQQQSGVVAQGGKSKTSAALLALFLGGAGVHKFYLGSWGWGLLYLLFIWTYVPALLGLIDFIVLLCMSQEKFDVKYAPGTESAFKW